MIAASIVQEIRRLLEEKHLSQRKIASLTGVSRHTVRKIANGQHLDYLEHRREEEWPEISGPLERCSSCGGRVYMPCRLCMVRNRMAGKPRQTVAAKTTSDMYLGVDLPPELYARYEEVRRRRIESESLQEPLAATVSLRATIKPFPENLL